MKEGVTINVFFFGLRNVGDMAIDFSSHGGKMANENKHVQKLVVTSKKTKLLVVVIACKLTFEGLAIVLMTRSQVTG